MTQFDAFGFLGDCLAFGVEEACEMRDRGGIEHLISANVTSPIHFEIYYREVPKERPITYEISIDTLGGRPAVVEERLRQRRKGAGSGRPYSFLYLHHGQGLAWKGEAAAGEAQEDQLDRKSPTREVEELSDAEWVSLTDNQHLGIATLELLKSMNASHGSDKFLQGWHLGYFDPSAARARPKAGAQKHLNVRGDNLST